MIETKTNEVQNNSGETQPLLPAGFKICRQCGIEAKKEMFKKSKDYKDGYSTICKNCHNKNNKAYGYDKEKANLRKKKWKKNNPEREKEIQRKSAKKRWENGKVQEYRIKNREKLLLYRKEWRLKNKEKENQRTRNWRKNNLQKAKESNKKSQEKRKDENLRLNKIWRKKNTQELGNYYIKNILREKNGFTTEQIEQNPELIEVKRLIIKTKRL